MGKKIYKFDFCTIEVQESVCGSWCCIYDVYGFCVASKSTRASGRRAATIARKYAERMGLI